MSSATSLLTSQLKQWTVPSWSIFPSMVQSSSPPVVGFLFLSLGCSTVSSRLSLSLYGSFFALLFFFLSHPTFFYLVSTGRGLVPRRCASQWQPIFLVQRPFSKFWTSFSPFCGSPGRSLTVSPFNPCSFLIAPSLPFFFFPPFLPGLRELSLVTHHWLFSHCSPLFFFASSSYLRGYLVPIILAPDSSVPGNLC